MQQQQQQQIIQTYQVSTCSYQMYVPESKTGVVNFHSLYKVFNLIVDYFNHILQSSFFKSTFQNTAQIVPKGDAFDNLIHRQSKNYLHISQVALSQDYKG